MVVFIAMPARKKIQNSKIKIQDDREKLKGSSANRVGDF
jgi:hypothetical protein